MFQHGEKVVLIPEMVVDIEDDGDPLLWRLASQRVVLTVDSATPYADGMVGITALYDGHTISVVSHALRYAGPDDIAQDVLIMPKNGWVLARDKSGQLCMIGGRASSEYPVMTATDSFWWDAENVRDLKVVLRITSDGLVMIDDKQNL